MTALPTLVSRCIRTALLGSLPFLGGCVGTGESEKQAFDPALYNQAKELEAQKRYPAAVDAYLRFIEGEGGNSTHTFAMIKVSVLQESIRNGEDPLLDLYLQAADQREAGNWQEALVTLDTLLQQGPNSRLADDALYLKAYIHLVDKRSYQQAYELMGELLASYPNSTYTNTAIYSQGLAQKNLGNVTKATEHFTMLRNLHTGLTVGKDINLPY